MTTSRWQENNEAALNEVLNDHLFKHRDSGSPLRLLTAALDAFANRGYHGTTTRDIAKRAGMSSAAIYMHYKSKAQMLFEIISVTHQAMVEELRGVFATYQDPVERLDQMVRTHSEFHALHHTAARVSNYELRSLTSEQRKQIMAVRDEIEDLMRETIRLGIESGDVRVDDLEATNIAVLSLGIDVSRWFSPGGRLSPKQVGELNSRLVMRSLNSKDG